MHHLCFPRESSHGKVQKRGRADSSIILEGKNKVSRLFLAKLESEWGGS